MRYALITDGTVTNIAEIAPSIAENEFPTAVQTDIAGIGDEYHDGRFYRDGEIVKTQAELYAEALQENADMKEALEILGVEAEDEYEDI